MDKRKRWIGIDFIQHFFSGRLLVFCVFQFSILHYYTDSVKQYAVAAEYPAAAWILPFMGQNVYFRFMYGISTIYFYSDVPFMQRHEMYVLMRQGRRRWVFMKFLRIWISALTLAASEFLLSILVLVPNLEWTSGWGKLYHSLALTDAGAAHQVRLFFPYELINENSALTTVLLLFAVLCIAAGLTGTVMFAVSLYASRTAAILVGTLLAVLTVVFENLYLWQAWIGFVSPFSWIDLLLIYGRVCGTAPTFPMVCAGTVALGLLSWLISCRAVESRDLGRCAE